MVVAASQDSLDRVVTREAYEASRAALTDEERAYLDRLLAWQPPRGHTIGLVDFAAEMMRGYERAPHLYRLAGELEDAARIPRARILVSMPPRHGKSLLSSVLFPAWYLGRHPDRRVVLASYGADLSETFSRQVRAAVDDARFGELFPGVRLARDSRSADRWDIAGKRGGVRAVGVGGGLTGHGADLLIIDDPFRDRLEASSALQRDRVWDWYVSTAYTRLEPGGAVVIVCTRWHEDDLVGRLLDRATAGQGDMWQHLRLPALSDDGEALWPQRYPVEELAAIRALSEYEWSALYQGNPTPREGAFFAVGRLETVDALPAGLPACRGWDLAASAGKGDWTAGVQVAGPDERGLWYVADVRRGQWATDERNDRMRGAAHEDGTVTRIRLAEDPGQAGKDQAGALTRLLAGYSVTAVRVSGDKATRADAFSAQVNAGNVRLVRGDWNRAYIEELRQFPLGANDDQVDATADAFAELTLRQKRVIGHA